MMSHLSSRTLLGGLLLALGSLSPAFAAEEYAITIKDHQFEPAEVVIPAGTKVKLRVHNQDATPEEFESYELHREKIIAGGASAVIFVGPLEPGTYPFFGEFHPDTAQGRLRVE